MATIAEGAALLLNDGKPIYWQDNNDFVLFFGLGSTGPVPNLVIGFFVLAIIGQIVLMKTCLGFNWRSIGGNAQAAYWSGIDTPKYTMLAYACAAMMSGIAGIFMFARIGTSEPAAGITWTMDALAASVLGGTVIGGKGKGSITGALLGAFILGMINNIFNLINVSTYVQYIAKGFILFAAIIIGSHSFRLPEWAKRWANAKRR
jgi:ribose/xylose/arabinose/galactoside ABC-type transport system permease subunit